MKRAKKIGFSIPLMVIFVLLLLISSAVHAETELETAVRLATEAISEIPHVSMLRLSDKPTVENARYLVGRAKHEHGAVDADFENLPKLETAEERIRELEGEDRGLSVWVYILLVLIVIGIIAVIVILTKK